MNGNDQIGKVERRFNECYLDKENMCVPSSDTLFLVDISPLRKLLRETTFIYRWELLEEQEINLCNDIFKKA